MKRVVTLLLMALGLAIGFVQAKAQHQKEKTMLIINSYHEDELWSNNMTKPVEIMLAKNDSVMYVKEYLYNLTVTDHETFETICDNIFARYEKNKPDYVMLVGIFSFTMRERIKEEWGDIPILLVTRVDSYAPEERYITDNDIQLNVGVNEQSSLGQLRDQFNFTAVVVPDFYRENIDLMMRLIPDMKEFVFISDKAFVNKHAAKNIQSTLRESYPNVKFRWIQGSKENSSDMIDMLTTVHPKTGILISSWGYEITNAHGYPTITSQDLTFLRGARNPVFSLRQHYMSMGCVGGVSSNSEEILNAIVKDVEDMLSGKDMRKIPFVMPEAPQVSVDYDLMKRYDLSFKDLPKGTIVRNSPKSYLEQYWMYTALLFLVLLILIIGMLLHNRLQRKRITVLERHTDFINNMPMPYTKSVLWLDNNENIINITYEIKNQAYEKLISDNSLPDNPLHLFDNAYLSDIAKKLLSTHKPVNITYHFKRTGIYCYFIFVPLKAHHMNKTKSSGNGNNGIRLDVDVFALDMTKDHMLQQKLRDQAVTIDISMEMAQLVPWQWDFNNDEISFYTSHKFMGTGSMTTKDGKPTTTIKFDELIKLMPTSDAEEMQAIYRKITRGECKRLDKEFRLFRGEDNTQFDWCENHGVVTDTDSDGRPLRMTGSIQFITDRKRQEETMAQALTKAKESDMLKSAFLANMSHEIRTPLNAIVGFSNLLTTTNDPTERAEFAEIINRNNELLLSLINDILDLAKIESNTITLTYDLCDIHDLIHSISKTVSIRVPKGVKLNVAHYADSCIVKADASHVSQVLINLLTNATKFTKRGSITVGYEIIEDENKLYFYVKDTGIGIKQENIERVFNRFVKLNNFVQGSGLGLAICRTLVEKMGGEIGVESPGEGRGCTFWFTIPYDPTDLKIEDKEIVHDAMQAEHIVGEHADLPAKVEQEGFEFKNIGDISSNALEALPNDLTVLVAEDNPSNYWLMARLMQDKFKLHHAENGKIALDMQQQVNPDIIVMDINMPEMDGYEAVAELRKRGVMVPIIAVTAYAFASDRVRILNSGFDAFVSKPVSASILYDTIVEVWERKQMKKQ